MALQGIHTTALRALDNIGAEATLRADLKGIDYVFNAKGISQHPNFVEWIGEAVREVLEKPPKDDGKKVADDR